MTVPFTSPFLKSINLFMQWGKMLAKYCYCISTISFSFSITHTHMCAHMHTYAHRAFVQLWLWQFSAEILHSVFPVKGFSGTISFLRTAKLAETVVSWTSTEFPDLILSFFKPLLWNQLKGFEMKHPGLYSFSLFCI